ncbi:TIGR04438 family Trp-rich protein [Comamonas composti]|uniref:TIGR04438 family Trp-rich protein n=1 Tax=Comamonas composti TaxID=408558 RepID=UPI000407F55D|nr:TIGR04438 family Trp-rich protein [Comamonas composti]
MYLLGLAVLLSLLKLAEVDPVAGWPWWWILLVYGLTTAWWAWADSSGYTKRRQAEKEVRRREQRIKRQKESLGSQARKR